jgi:hypothetical protein
MIINLESPLFFSNSIVLYWLLSFCSIVSAERTTRVTGQRRIARSTSSSSCFEGAAAEIILSGEETILIFCRPQE